MEMAARLEIILNVLNRMSYSEIRHCLLMFAGTGVVINTTVVIEQASTILHTRRGEPRLHIHTYTVRKCGVVSSDDLLSFFFIFYSKIKVIKHVFVMMETRSKLSCLFNGASQSELNVRSLKRK
jgi:hypothetical protein